MEMQADRIQGVLFLLPGQRQDDALQVWERLFPDDRPDGFQRGAATPALNSTANGERQGLQTTISVQVGRIDILFNPPMSVAAESSDIPRIEDVPVATECMAKLLKRAVENQKALRIAIVLELSKTISNGEESTEMAQLLPAFLFPINSSELLVQINLRKNFRFSSELVMNRLCVWSTGQVGYVKAPMTIGTQIMTMMPPIMTPYIGFKIDVNSAPEMQLPDNGAANAIDEILLEVLALRSNGLAGLQRD